MDEVNEQIQELLHAYREERIKNINADNRNIATTMFNAQENENLIKFQLDIKEELERIERLLRGHVPKIDAKGGEYWELPPIDENLFNEKGVREILKRVSSYLTKTIILSNYTQEQINFIMKEFGKRLTDFVVLNAEEFGLNTEEKRRHFPMILTDLINIVEASYQRALNGQERESLRSARMVTQTEGLNQDMNNMISPIRHKFNIFKPQTWGK